MVKQTPVNHRRQYSNRRREEKAKMVRRMWRRKGRGREGERELSEMVKEGKKGRGTERYIETESEGERERARGRGRAV